MSALPPAAPVDYTTLILQAVNSVVGPAVDAAIGAGGPIGVAAAGALATLLPVLIRQVSPPTTAEVAALQSALAGLDAAIAGMPGKP
jgi:hypothetical protein